MAAKKRGKASPTAAEKDEWPRPPKPPIGAPELADESSSPPPNEDLSAKEPARPELPVAGLVASAGGLDAFKKFFTAMPVDSGIAFVLIPHLDPRTQA